MNKKQIEQLKKIIEEEEKQYDFNDYVFNYADEDQLKEIETIEDLSEYMDLMNQGGGITTAEVIYHHIAIDYLKEHDPSLMESLGLAHEMGFETGDINSELLASLLMTQNNEEDWNDFLINVKKACADLFEVAE